MGLASSNQNIEIVQLLLENDANVNAQCFMRSSALHFAAESDNLEIINLLIQYGADIDIHNREVDTPLHVAQNKNNSNVVKRLVEEEERINKMIFGINLKTILSDIREFLPTEGKDLHDDLEKVVQHARRKFREEIGTKDLSIKYEILENQRLENEICRLNLEPKNEEIKKQKVEID